MSQGAQGAQGGQLRAALLAVGGVALVLLVVGWASTLGPSEVLRGPGPVPERTAVSPAPDTTPSPSDSPSEAAQQPPAADSSWMSVVEGLVVLVAVLVAGWALLLLLRWVLGLLRERRRVPDTPDPVDPFDSLDESERLSAAMSAGIDDQRAALTRGTPREGIEACWARLEEHASAAGVERRPWETSSEFTRRVLAATGADPSAVQSLGDLYREARHSSHVLGETERRSAEAALARIQLSWGSATQAGVS